MRYRIVVQITDDAGTVTEQELMPETVSEPGWRCSHAIWPAWAKGEQTTECGWCHEPLEACEIVECRWCEGYFTIDAVLAHWHEGCGDEESVDEVDTVETGEG